MFLNDGLISLKVLSVEGRDVRCEVRAGGELSSRKGLDLPGIDLGISAFTTRDRDCLAFALEQGVDAVSQSFVSSAEDVIAVREAAVGMGYQPFIIAEIERARAIDRLDDILAAGRTGSWWPVVISVSRCRSPRWRSCRKRSCAPPIAAASRWLPPRRCSSR
jgi:pyruvate kinase